MENESDIVLSVYGVEDFREQSQSCKFSTSVLAVFNLVFVEYTIGVEENFQAVKNYLFKYLTNITKF